MPFVRAGFQLVMPDADAPSPYPGVRLCFIVNCPSCGKEREVRSHSHSLRPLLEVRPLNPLLTTSDREGEESLAQAKADRAIAELHQLLRELHRHWVCQAETCGGSYALPEFVIEREKGQLQPQLSREWLTAQLRQNAVEVPESLVV